MEALNVGRAKSLTRKWQSQTGIPGQLTPEPVPLQATLNYVISKARDGCTSDSRRESESQCSLEGFCKTGHWMQVVLVSFFVNLMQTRGTWEERTSTEKLPPSD